MAADVSFSTHCGTHIEFLHHWKGGDDAMTYPLTQMIGECQVLDFVGKQAGEGITLAEMQQKAAAVREGDIVFIRTDFAKSGAPRTGSPSPLSRPTRWSGCWIPKRSRPSARTQPPSRT